MIELINQALIGDMYAQTQLYELTKNKAYYLALQLLRNQHDAEDVLQDAYITAFSKLGTLDNANKFEGWLDTIVVNRAKDILRRKKPFVFADMNVYDEEEDKENEPDIIDDRIEFRPEENMDYQETKRLIQEIIDELPEEQRIAVMLYYYKDMSVGEIAAYAECSANTIKSRLNYARKTIKSKVEGLEKNGTKLYSIPVLPFLYYMFRTQASEAVCSSTNIIQGIQGASASYSMVGEAVKATTDTVGNAASQSGLQGAVAVAKAGGMTIGIKAGIAAVIATVSITGGILVYNAATPEEVKEVVKTEQAVSEVEEETEPVVDEIVPEEEPETVVEEKAFEWEGSWNRTDVAGANPAGLDITSKDEEGFDFHINAGHGGNIGDVEGHATFTSETEANAIVPTFEGNDDATFEFNVVDDRIEVTSVNSDFFCGMGVYLDGSYILGEPTYTNANILEEVFGDNLEDVKNLLGSKDYDTLAMIMQSGSRYESDLSYSGFLDGVGYGADVWIKEDGTIYCLILDTYSGYRFFTNDPKHRNSVPKEFGELREGMGVTYIYSDKR